MAPCEKNYIHLNIKTNENKNTLVYVLAHWMFSHRLMKVKLPATKIVINVLNITVVRYLIPLKVDPQI